MTSEQEDENADVEPEVSPTTIRNDLIAALCVSEEEVSQLLRAPQRHPSGRAHELWLQGRRGRLTASRFAGACGVSSAKKGRRAIVAEMLAMPEGRPQQAKRFGVQHEDIAREAYVAWRKADAKSSKPLNLRVQPLGLCVWLQEPWLAGSPDGLCMVDGQPEGLLEVKTAQSMWHVDDELPVEWRYQVHGCMKVTSEALGHCIPWCDLFIWTPKEQLCRRVDFDEELWQTAMLFGSNMQQ
ncbi:unnamed protein product [Effrenium voratum]|nr:unnamed protein product [Effrenium voratum]